MNKIIFLGTGGGRHVTAYQLRSTAGILLMLNQTQIHIDPGPGSLLRLKDLNLNPSQTSLILVSHHDIDHCNDLNCAIDAMTYGGIKKKGILISTNTVINGSEKESPYLTNYHRNCLTKIKPLKPAETLKLPNLTIEALKTKHNQEDCIGFKIFSESAVITYASDTEYAPKLADQYKDSDILILNTLRPGSKKLKGHLCSKDAIELINRVKPKITILQHFGKTMLDANPMYEARTIANETKQHVIAATDGFELDLKDYSAEAKQKTLASF